MQDRSYAIAIAGILAICCLGAYVAVTGFWNIWNTRPPSIGSNLANAITPVSIVLATATPAPTQPGATLAPPPPTEQALAPLGMMTPLGVMQTITASATMASPLPVPTFTSRPTSPPVPPSPPTQSCVNFQFCGSGGPPSPDPQLAPMGILCPAAYIWGRVVDRNGAGMPGVRIQFKGPAGEIAQVETKGPPDPPGVYNIPAGTTSGTYTLWVLDPGGGKASPQYNVMAPQGYAGTASCPTRLDFRAQR